MESWWQLGEGSGQWYTEFKPSEVTCPFCLERGNFGIVSHFEKKKPNDEKKKLNFDTYKCGNCSGFVMVLWSAGDRLHDFRVLPWPLKLSKAPEEFPADVGRYWMQAHRSLSEENWDAAAVMARSSLQIALRSFKAEGKNLKEEIDSVADSGLLPPIMKDWSHNVRELGNDSAHPEPGQAPTDPNDANDIVQFMDYLLEYLYTLPTRISKYQKRREPK